MGIRYRHYKWKLYDPSDMMLDNSKNLILLCCAWSKLPVVYVMQSEVMPSGLTRSWPSSASDENNAYAAPGYACGSCKLRQIKNCHLKFIIHLCGLAICKRARARFQIWRHSNEFMSELLVQIWNLCLVLVCLTTHLIFLYQTIVPFCDIRKYFLITEIRDDFWYQKFIRFSTIKNYFLISEDYHGFLISENDFPISETNLWYQKIISDIRK